MMKLMLLFLALTCLISPGRAYRHISDEELEEIANNLENEIGSQDDRRFHNGDKENDLINDLEDEYENDLDGDDDDEVLSDEDDGDDGDDLKSDGAEIETEKDDGDNFKSDGANVKAVKDDGDKTVKLEEKKDASARAIYPMITPAPTQAVTTVAAKTEMKGRRNSNATARPKTKISYRIRRLGLRRFGHRHFGHRHFGHRRFGHRRFGLRRFGLRRLRLHRLRLRLRIPRLRRVYHNRRHCTYRCHYVRGYSGIRKHCRCI